MDEFQKLVVNLPFYKDEIINYISNYLCEQNFFYNNSLENYISKKNQLIIEKLFIIPTLFYGSYFH